MDINRILNELRAERDRLEKAISALESVGGKTVGQRSPVSATPKRNKTTRRLSAAGRKRISQAMKKRWAEARKKKTA
ncbi:MAG: hypothetical protein JWO13_450 [Acidobacteriales bacterium]|nr:hypothetical protein [Terriglobales bacterium]